MGKEAGDSGEHDPRSRMLCGCFSDSLSSHRYVLVTQMILDPIWSPDRTYIVPEIAPTETDPQIYDPQ